MLEYVKRKKEDGHKTVLVTASDQKVAELISGHTQIFDEVAASDGKTNLKSHRKAEYCQKQFGKGLFDYIGNESCDLAIWEAGGNAVLANEDTDLEEKAKAVNLQVQSIGPILPSKPKPSSVPAAHINGPKTFSCFCPSLLRIYINLENCLAKRASLLFRWAYALLWFI